MPESKQLDNASSVASAVEILNVTKTDMDCGLEVSLPWDPLSAATNIISDAKMALKASKFGCPVSKHDSGKKEDNPDLKKMQLKGICGMFTLLIYF